MTYRIGQTRTGVTWPSPRLAHLLGESKSSCAEARCFELGVTEVGCMAHSRRKFHELWVNHQSQVGEQALKFFGLLYDVEREPGTRPPGR